MTMKQEHSSVNSTGQSEGFHTELHRRRMRCTLVFLLLASGCSLFSRAAGTQQAQENEDALFVRRRNRQSDF